MLVGKRRLRLLQPPAMQRETILSTGIKEEALTGEIAISSVELAGLHGDPADRFITATAIARDATLMTADATLLRWNHPLPRINAAT